MSVNRPQLIVAVHVLVALGLVGVGLLRVNAGNVVGGIVNGFMGIAVVAVGLFIARRQ